MKVLTLLSVLFCASINISYANTSKETGVTPTQCKYSDQKPREEVSAKEEKGMKDKSKEVKVLPKG